MKVLRTPDERFKDLADYPFEPHYTNIVTDDTGRKQAPVPVHFSLRNVGTSYHSSSGGKHTVR
jgi:hypothetical protein